MALETLHCESGNHKWQRMSTRGRKPRNCPVAHNIDTPATPSESVPTGRNSDDGTSPQGESESKPQPNVTGAALAARVHESMKRLVEKDAARLAKHRKHSESEL